jgi:D-glycero-alpha-D-manno-heptose 1-phosphate guanylyltransferase
MTTAIILAGGLGTRLRDAVPDLPKPMAPVQGRPFLEYQMDYWIAQGVSRFILSVGYRREAIIGHFGAAYRGVPIDYAFESTPLGTGGGLLLAAEKLNDATAFLLLNGDTFFAVDLQELEAFHVKRGAGWTFALFRADEAGRYMGVATGADGRIQSLRSGKGEIGALANGGVYLVDPAWLHRIRYRAGDKVSLEDELLPAFDAAGGSLFGMTSTGRFIDIGVPADYRRAAQVLESPSSPQSLAAN